MSLASPRLIEKGFPCHQVGAETRRERNASSALPPHFFLHIWWARRPLVPSRAAVLGSILDADYDHGTFLQEMGLEMTLIEVAGQNWVITGELLKHIPSSEFTPNAKWTRAFNLERHRRASRREMIQKLSKSPILNGNPILQRWSDEVSDFTHDLEETTILRVKTAPADPSHVNERLDFAIFPEVKSILGKELRWDPEELYGYSRAYERLPRPEGKGLTVLDPTSGGGSIPLEAIRAGAKVFANELNPVASVILAATLDYPKKFGHSLIPNIQQWGLDFEARVNQKLEPYYHFNSDEHDHQGVLFCRQIISPHCGKPVPLVNGTYVSKIDEDKWALRMKPNPGGDDVEFEFYSADRGLENPQDHGVHLIKDGKTKDWRSIQQGKAICIWTGMEISGDEIKRQAQAGEMTDRMMAVVAKRWVPATSNRDRGRWMARVINPSFTARKGKQSELFETLNEDWTEADTNTFTTTVLQSLAKTGAVEIRKEKLERYFRAPNDNDLKAFNSAEAELKRRWAEWEEKGMIPDEVISKGQKTREPENYGMPRWCDLFNPRQLLAHLTATETLLELKPRILSELGQERGKAVVTYMHFIIDKGLDYNSRQTRWDSSPRQKVINTFGRHDFSLKWVYGEMVYSGLGSGIAWGLSQIMDAYTGLANLLENAPGEVEIINGSAARMDGIKSESVDVVVNDPPYYDNVQYAELSDYFYVWQRRTLADLYPFFRRREADKQNEAVANPVRDGSAKSARAEYENRMREIYAECRRVLTPDGIMTIMFTHKKAEAWDTLTRALITSGWRITSTYPIESESSHSMHQMGKASAASSVFLVCRKRDESRTEPAAWRVGEGGVQAEVDAAVRRSLPEFEALGLSPVDRMVAAYGRALQVLSDRWPVMDGDEEITPVQAMSEASLVVAEREVERITGGSLSVNDLNSEAAMAVIAFGIWGIGFADKAADRFVIPFDPMNQVSRSLGIKLEEKNGNYRFTPEQKIAGLQKSTDAFHAPFQVKGSNLRLVLPEERSEVRLDKPQSEWDALHGIIMAYRKGEIPLVRAYLNDHADYKDPALKLLQLWSEQIIDPNLTKEAKLIQLEL